MATPDFSSMTDAELDAYISKAQGDIQQLKSVDPDRSILSSAKAFISGSDRDPNIPVLGELPASQFGFEGKKYNKLVTAISASFDDESLVKAIRKAEPDALFDKDMYGNIVVGGPVRNEDGDIVRYQKFYPNPKGLDAPTLMQGAYVMGTGGQLERAQRAVGLPVKGFKGAVALGMGEAGLLESVSSQASGRPFRLSEIPSGAFGSAIGRGVVDAAGLVFNIASLFKNNPEQFIIRTNEVQEAILGAGFDPEEIMPKVRSEIERQVREGLDPIESVRSTTAASLPVPVTLTKGQVTGDTGQQLFEDQVADSVYGEIPAQIMVGAQTKAREAIQQNIPAIQATMAGDDIAIQRGEGMASAQAELVEQKKTAEKAYKDAYKGAGGTGSFVIPENAPMAQSVISDRLGEFRRTSSPSAFALADELTGMFQDGRSLKELFEFRKSITALSAAGGTEKGAAGALKGAFDDILVEQAEKGLLYGNPADVAAGLDAISKFKEFKQLWETKGVLTTLTTKEMRDGRFDLKVAPEDAANAILGKSIAQTTSKKDLTRDLLTLKKNLPEQQWNQVRQEVFILLADKMHNTGMVNQDPSLMFNKLWRDLKQKNPSMVNSLFSKEEIADINNLAVTSALIAGTAKNTSKSASAAMGALQRLSQSFAVAGGYKKLAAVSLLKPITSTVAGLRLIPTTRGAMTPAQSQAGLFGTFAGVGGTMGTESPILSPLEQAMQEQQSRE